MRKIKKLLTVFGILILVTVASGWWYLDNIQPTYEGSLKIKGLSTETTVYFDDFGIPHIYAENQQDALLTLGYVHAQDRLWQMELLRRIAPGRLSEILGADMLKNDKFFSALGIEETSKRSLKKLDPNSDVYKEASAYLAGINQFIDNGPSPIEFTLLGIEKEHFEIVDIYNILGYMSFSFAMAQKTDPLLSLLQNKLGDAYMNDLNIDIKPNTTLIKNSKIAPGSLEQLVSDVHEIMQKLPVPSFIGSNSWVVAPEKTNTGSVLFANDPHIAFSQPTTWYEAHITTPDHEMYGYHIAGVPFPLLGHNRAYAYGLTMFENDDMDFYLEESHETDPEKYRTKDGYESFKNVTKTILVKDEAPVELTIRSTNHGPIMNDFVDQIDQISPIALSWVYTKFDVEILEALHTISTAKKMADVKKGASLIHAPGLNIMYGDKEGNVAWWAAGKLYTQQPHVNRKFILNGASGFDDPINYLNFNENPMAENPPWNYVYSANNQPDSIAGMLYPGYYLPEDRAKRIVSLLNKKNNWDKTSMANMINDGTSAIAPDIIKEFTNIMEFNSFTKNEQRAIDVLQLWDGSNRKELVAPTIYNRWIYTYLKKTFKDEMGEKIFEQLMETHFMKRLIGEQIQKDESIWWDDISTENIKENKKQILSESLSETIAFLENQLGPDLKDWNWEKVHTLEHPHAFGAVSYLRSYFNIGPFPMNGAREVIDNRGYKYDDSGWYNIYMGPSTRRIVDFSDIENSISILPTGQSGVPFSKHYKDQVEMYNKGQFRKMKMNTAEIKAVSTKLIMRPTNE